MAKGRKRHVQQEIRFANQAGNLRGVRSERRRKRRRARVAADGTVKRPVGRPPKGPRSSERAQEAAGDQGERAGARHAARRRRRGAAAHARGLQGRARGDARHYRREDCRIVHLSIQGNHVHLLVEAENRMALARGMQAFEISAAKHINAAVSNAGQLVGAAAAAREAEAAQGPGVRRPLSRGDHPHAASGAERARVRAQQLAQAPRAPREARARAG